MIGSGIFIVSADIGRQVSPWGPGGLLLVWVITGAMTVIGALAYAELAAMMPKAGGQYVFLREGLSPRGRVPLRLDPLRRHPDRHHRGGRGGLCPVSQRARSRRRAPTSSCPLGQVRLPGAADAIQLGLSPQRVVAILSILLLTAINARGVTLGAAIQTIFCVAKVGALAVLVLFGLTLFRSPMSRPPTSPTSGARATGRLAMVPLIGAAMVGSLFSSDAWNNVTFAAAEVQNPSRNLPARSRSAPASVSLLYILAQRRLPECSAVLRRSQRARMRSPAASSTRRRTGSAPRRSRSRSAPARRP